MAYAEYEETFGLGPELLVFLSGPDVFTAPFLEKVEELTGTLQKLEGTSQVASPLDLREPTQFQGRVVTTRPLGPYVYQDPAALAAKLADEAFVRRWAGTLFDAELRHFLVVVSPEVDDADPFATETYLKAVEDAVAAAFAELDVEVHLAGMFYVNQEILRATARDQERLTRVSTGLQLVLMWALFGRLLASGLVLLLLGISITLGFVAMGFLGVPVNFMSGNLPVMVGVIGTADIIHILGSYCRLRKLYRPRGAAIRSMRRTFLPNLLTTVTTLGCIAVTAITPMKLLESFSVALSLGVVIVYVVTIVYGPLLFMRSGIEAGDGWIYGLQDWLSRTVRSHWLPFSLAPSTLVAWGLFSLAVCGLTATQSINSNWFRNFGPGLPFTRTIDFLQREGLAVSAVQCTLQVDTNIETVLDDEAMVAELGELEAAMRALPGVVGVHSLHSFKRALDSRWAELEWPERLPQRWIETRRQAAYRQFLSMGAFDQYWNGLTHELRFVVTTRIEDSRGFLRLRDQIERAVDRLDHHTYAREDFRPRGHILYWSAIIDAVSAGYFRTLVGSLLVILVCFLVVTASPAHALLALVPNALPVLTMFALARLMGLELTENFCTLAALSIGIAVDDSRHLLYHYRREQARGRSPRASLEEAYRVCGAPVIMTSACLILGFSLCVTADMVPTAQNGIFLTATILTALLADLTLMPALLVRLDAGPPPGEGRQYTAERAGLPALRRR